MDFPLIATVPIFDGTADIDCEEDLADNAEAGLLVNPDIKTKGETV